MKYIFKASLFLFLGSIFFSCKKNQPACKGNCVDIALDGKFYVKTTGKGLANVPVEVTWFKKGVLPGIVSYKVASGNTANDGSFHFNSTIDSSFFENYALSVRAPADTNYISLQAEGGSDFNEIKFFNLDVNGMRNMNFEFYPKTFLTINLHRTENDGFEYFSVEHTFVNKIQYQDYILTGQQTAGDTILTVPTSTDIFTKIIWTKIIGLGQSIEKTDSLVCTKTGPNVFNINY